MSATDRIFQRTRKGEAIARRGAPRGLEDAALLATVEGLAHFDAIALAHPQLHERRLAARLNALEARGYLESVEVDWLLALQELGRLEPQPATAPSVARCA